MLYPFLCLLLAGYNKSLSSYWGSSVEPIFIIANILVAYFFFTTKNWKMPSIFLILVTAFNNILYPNIHNVFAICFFLVSFRALFNNKRYLLIKLLYLIGAFTMIINLLIGEIICILAIGLYHTFKLNKLNKLMNMKNLIIISDPGDEQPGQHIYSSDEMELFICTICKNNVYGITNNFNSVKLNVKYCDGCLFKIK